MKFLYFWWYFEMWRIHF